MTYLHLRASAIAALMLAAIVPAAHGQGRPLSNPADADAPVPPTRYEPFLPMADAPAGTSSPADNWKALNRTVAESDSMSMTMEMEAKAEAATPPAPAAGMKSMPMPPAPPDPHAHHHPREVK